MYNTEPSAYCSSASSGRARDERLEQALRRFELPLADLGDGQRVLIRQLARFQRRCFGQRRFGVLQQVHLEADAAKSQQDLGRLRREFPRPHPVRQRSLELLLLLGEACGLAQRLEGLGLETHCGVVGVERPRRLAVQQVRAGEVERQLVGERAHLPHALENLDAFTNRVALKKRHRELDRPFRRHAVEARPVVD